jgi:parvulin-like peptidyl-prolyl isomerase
MDTSEFKPQNMTDDDNATKPQSIMPASAANSSFMSENTKMPEKKQKGGKLLWVAIILIVLAGIAIAIVFNPGGILDRVVPEDETGETVALVNGQKLRRSELVARVSQARSIFEAQGAKFETEEQIKELEDLSLENLINETLLIQEANDKGISAGDAEVEEQYKSIAEQSGGEEQLLNELAQNNVTPKEFRENIYKQMLLKNFIDSATTDVVVSDQEVSEYYNELEGQGADLPPLEEIRASVAYEIRQRKVADILVPMLNQLRESAEIQINI